MDADRSALFLFGEAMGYTYAAALRAAAATGVADHMADEPRDIAGLAADTGCDAAGLRRVLRMLVARGIVAQEGQDRFRLTAAGSALRSDAPRSARAGILMLTDDMFWKTSHVLAETIRTQDPSFASIFGCTVGEYFDSDPEKEALFYEGMEAVSGAEDHIVARACELPGSGTVADIGGRYGGFLLAVLEANPSLRGVLFDKPDEVVKHRLDAAGVAGRVDIVAGDFFVAVPPADVYLLKRIIHNWNDEQSVRILENCRRAMRPGGRVLVIDAIVPPAEGPHDSKAMDFMMLGALTGGERTAAELEPLAARAGLRLCGVVPTGAPMSVAVTETA
jgi:orsellinic acid C3-O-methyltransferase